MDFQNDLCDEDPPANEATEENNEDFVEDDDIDLLLLNKSEDILSETQKKISGKDTILDERSTLLKKNIRRSKKKLNAAGKKCLFIKVLLERDDLPTTVAAILRKEIEEVGSIENLESSELLLFWTEIYDYVKLLTSTAFSDNDVDNSVVASSVKALNEVLTLILYCKEYITCITSHHPLGLMIAFLNALLFTEIDFEFRFKICEVCELCCIAGVSFHGRFYLDTITFLLRTTLEKENISKALITRVWCMSQPIGKINLSSKACVDLVQYLIQVPKCPAYLAFKEGRYFMSFLFGRLEIKLIQELHQSVKQFLPDAKRNQAAAYGQVYFNAWATAKAEYRQVLEKVCIQNLMTHVFTLPRTNYNMGRLGQNVFEILKHFHDNRKHAHFSKIITELYAPLLWRYIRSGNNIERCNAAEVFLHVYPMEKPGQGMTTEMDFQEKQQNEMVELLSDKCHAVRIIAIKGICVNLERFWNTFPAEVIQVLVRIIVQELANDGSTPDVRRAVYRGLTIMLQNPSTSEYLRIILPQLQENIHDVNEKVRLAFVDMLAKLKHLQYPGFRFNNVVSVKHLLARLQCENTEVGEHIVHLLMDCIVTEDRDQTLLFICKMIVMNPLAARKFFKFSKNSLKFEYAVNIMKNILAVLRSHVKKKAAELQESGKLDQVETENESVQPKKKKRTSKKRSLNVLDTNIPEETRRPASPVEDNPYTLDNPVVGYALIDIVSILWYLHSKQLQEPENEQKLNDLYDLSGASIPLFLRFYKMTDKDMYFALIHLASLIPLNKLSPNSTIGSACMSQLKSISEVTPVHELNIYVLALCAWNRSGDIIELVINCLDQAFRSEGLNQSAVPPEGYKSRTVKFQHAEVKPTLALKLLDSMFNKHINHKRIMNKSYDQLYELLSYLCRAKVIAENRIIVGIPLDNAMLSDGFILQCLYRYYKTLIILHNYSANQQPSKVVNAAVEMIGIIEWSERVVFPFLSDSLEETPDLCERIIQDILRTSRHIIATNTGVDNEFLKKMAEFMRSILSSGSSLWFVEGSLNVIKFMNDHVEAYNDKVDEETILQTTIPVLMSYVFLSLSQVKYSQKVISTCVKNIKEAKYVLTQVLQVLRRRYGTKSPVVHSMLKMYVTTCVKVISLEIKELQVLDTVDKIAELPYVCTLLLNILMSQPALTKVWLSALAKEITTTFLEDAYMLLGCISLLHTLSCNYAKLPNESLCDVLRTAYTIANTFNPNLQQDSTVVDSTETTAPSTIDVKKLSLPVLIEIGSNLGCALT